VTSSRLPSRALRRSRLVGVEVSSDAGVTLIELLVTCVILVVVIGGLATLFVSAIHSQTDQSDRVESQQNARVALDQLRREIHCGSSVASNKVNVLDPSWPAKAITINLASYCLTNSAGAASITWCTSATAPYTLWRYPHSTDLSAGTYAAACTGTGRRWASDIVDTGAVTSGKIFSNSASPAPTQPAMASPILTLGATAGTLGGVSDTTYGYIVDPVTAAGEQPGTEAVVTLAAGTANRSITLDWSGSCPPYAGVTVTSYKVYGRTSGAETLMKTISVASSCATTSYTDTNVDAPDGTTSPQAAVLTTVGVDIPVRVSASGTGLAELKDDITLRNTPR
jgi:Tfp pilus assembly protein PilV